MLWKKTVIALIVFAVSLTAVIAGTALSGPQTGPPFGKPEFSVDDVTRVAIEGTDNAVVAQKDGGRWILVPGNLPADERTVTNAIEKAAELEVGSLVSTNPGLQEQLGVAGDGLKVTLSGQNGTIFSFFVGKETGDNRGNFVRKDGIDRVYQTASKVKYAFDKQRKYWRKREFFDVDRDRVARLVIKKDGSSIALTKAPGQWEYETVPPGLPEDYRLDRQSIEAMATTLDQLMATEFVDEDKPLSDFGLEPPRMEIEAYLAGEQEPRVLLVGDTKDKKVYVKRADQPWVYQVQSYVIDKLDKDVASLRDMTVNEFELADARGLLLRFDGSEIEFANSGSGAPWQVTRATEPVQTGFALDPQQVRMTVSTLSRLKGDSLAGKGNYGFDKPYVEAIVTLDDGSEKRFVFGNEAGDKERYVTGGDGKVYTLAARHADRLRRPLQEYSAKSQRQKTPMLTPDMLKNLPPEVQQQFLQKQRQEIMQRQLMKQFQRQREQAPPAEEGE